MRLEWESQRVSLINVKLPLTKNMRALIGRSHEKVWSHPGWRPHKRLSWKYHERAAFMRLSRQFVWANAMHVSWNSHINLYTTIIQKTVFHMMLPWESQETISWGLLDTSSKPSCRPLLVRVSRDLLATLSLSLSLMKILWHSAAASMRLSWGSHGIWDVIRCFRGTAIRLPLKTPMRLRHLRGSLLRPRLVGRVCDSLTPTVMIVLWNPVEEAFMRLTSWICISWNFCNK